MSALRNQETLGPKFGEGVILKRGTCSSKRRIGQGGRVSPENRPVNKRIGQKGSVSPESIFAQVRALQVFIGRLLT